MQISTPKQKSSSNDPLWNFLAECSLCEFVSDKETGDALKAGLLFQTLRDLGIPQECLYQIERTLVESINQTRTHINQGQSTNPTMIRIFLKKMMISSGNLTKASSDLQTGQTIEPAQLIHPGSTQISGGWGFFIVERAREFPADSTVDTPNFIDLFLYQEIE